MKKQRIFSLFTVLLFFVSCKGQMKNQEPATVNKTSGITSIQPKLVKTQGTDQFDQVRCGAIDKNGNLWFGTTGEGVYRYDGKGFTNFTTKDGLCSNTVWSVLCDTTGKIWLGTDSGLCCYEGAKFSIVPITLASENDLTTLANHQPSSKCSVWCMLQDKTGKIWLGTSQGVYWYKNNTFTRFTDPGGFLQPETLALNTIGYLLEDKNGNIWLGSGMPAGGEGLCRYDPASGKLTHFEPGGEVWIRYLVEDKNGMIWLGTRTQGNWRYDPSSDNNRTSLRTGDKNFTHYTERVGIGAPMIVDQKGNIWFSGEEHENGYGGKGGVWCYDGKTFKNYTTKEGMGDYGVWCMVEDQDGNIWLGTRNVGLYRYNACPNDTPAQGKTFTSFSE